MQANLAILVALASRPNGRIAFAELELQLKTNESGKTDEQMEQQISAGIELIEAGLAVVDGDSLEITKAGRSFIEAYPDRSLLEANEFIDPLIDADLRSRIFNLGFRRDAETRGLKGSEPPEADGVVEVSAHSPNSAATDVDRGFVAQALASPAGAAPPSASTGHPSWEKDPTPDEGHWRTQALDTIAQRARRLGALWRRHLEDDLPKARTGSPGANVIAIAIALISLLVVIICAGAAVALRQISSLQAEISSLQRELSPLKEKLSRFDQAEKTRQAEERAREERSKRTADNPPPQAPFSLSREEIQLIRDYIKPAPSSATSSAPAVGDPIAGATIPFPSPIIEKVPKLLGARFAIRNGAILIVRRDSRQIDAVLGPN